MLQLNYIRDNKDEAIARLAIKNFDAKPIFDQVLQLDVERKNTQKELEAILNEANVLAKQVGDLYKQGKKAEGDELKSKSASLKENSKKLEEHVAVIEEQQHKLLVQVPNTPSVKVPKGKTPEDNENVFQEGEIPVLYDGAKPHWELTTKYDLIDFELGVKLT
nr:serine--tRNA ligase [Bacteroidota bacterium]